MSKCGAKTKKGKKCTQPAMENGRCRLHGGKTPRGLDSPQTKHGRYSKDLPTRLAGRFEQAMKDSELLKLNRELALLDTRIGEVLDELNTEGAGRLFACLQKAWGKYCGASPDEKADHFSIVDALIQEGAKDWMRWQEVYGLIEQRRKVAESEAKRQVQLKQTLTVSQAMTLLTAVVDVVKSNVRDEDTLRTISRDISGLLATGSRAAA